MSCRGSEVIFLLFLFQIFWGVVKSEERLDSEDYALTDLIATPRLYLQSGNVTINFLPFIFYSILAFILGKLSLKKKSSSFQYRMWPFYMVDSEGKTRCTLHIFRLNRNQWNFQQHLNYFLFHDSITDETCEKIRKLTFQMKDFSAKCFIYLHTCKRKRDNCLKFSVQCTKIVYRIILKYCDIFSSKQKCF